jgi:hypothetical protein
MFTKWVVEENETQILCPIHFFCKSYSFVVIKKFFILSPNKSRAIWHDRFWPNFIFEGTGYLPARFMVYIREQQKSAFTAWKFRDNNGVNVPELLYYAYIS